MQAAKFALVSISQLCDGHRFGRRGVRREQVEEVAVLRAQDGFVVEQLQHHQCADDLVLHAQRHRREGGRLRGRSLSGGAGSGRATRALFRATKRSAIEYLFYVESKKNTSFRPLLG